jgi:Subtilisin inhibitor-like
MLHIKPFGHGLPCEAMHTAAAALTALSITVSTSGGEPSMRWTLRCGPAGGSLPRPVAACTRLLAQTDPFAPVPKGVACTTIYGGPQTARVTGRFKGRSVWTSFSRRNGCEIARWNRVAFLFPGALAR